MTANRDFEKITNLGTVLFILSIVFIFVFPWLCFITTPIAIALMIKAKNKYPKEFEALKNQNKMKNSIKKFSVKHVQGVKFADFEQKIAITITENEVIFSYANKELEKFKFSEITNIEISAEEEFTIKNKSILLRTMICGLFFGSIGAVLGGLSGICPSVKTNYYLTISTNKSNSIVISADKNTLFHIKNMICNKINV